MPSFSNTSSMRWHGLDTLRALAIILVMLYHLNIQGLLPPYVGGVAKLGWVGVDLFFVLSGFLIGSQLLKPYLSGEKLSLTEFYLRRAYRILPAFLTVLLLYMLLPAWSEAPGPYAGWQYATFTWNLLLLGYPVNRAFSHVWSLCVEEHFYLLFPLLLLFLMRKPSMRKTALALSFITIGGMVLRAWLLHSVLQPAGDEQGVMLMKYIYYPTYSRLDGLVMGVGLAVVRTFKVSWWARFTRYSGLLALLGLTCLLGALWLCDFDYPASELPFSIVFAFPLLSCGFGLLVASAASEGSFLARRVPGASALATLAFSLYLTHKSVAHAVHLLLPRLTAEVGVVSSSIYAVACLGTASLLYFTVERPFIALRMRRSSKRVPSKTEDEVRLDPAI